MTTRCSGRLLTRNSLARPIGRSAAVLRATSSVAPTGALAATEPAATRECPARARVRSLRVGVARDGSARATKLVRCPRSSSTPRLCASVPAFRRLWWGLAISNLGAQLTVVAVGLQVYASRVDGSVGLLGLCALVPLVIFGLYGGAIVDHYDRRRVALVSSLVSWAVTSGSPSRHWLGDESGWVLFALVAVQSGAFAVNTPARAAIIPRLLEPRLLPAANALQTLGFSVAFTVGPLLGAALVAAFDYGVAYTVDAVLFTAALFAVFRLPAQPPLHSETRRERVGLGSVVDGFRYLGTQRTCG